MDFILLLTLFLCGVGIGVSTRRGPGPSFPASNCNRCPAGWTPYHGLCYLFHETRMTWIEAELYCIYNYGNLATIQSPDQYTFLRSLIFKAAESHKTTWVGGYDAVQEGVWLWSKGTKFDFTNWGPGEPNNFGGNEHCMEINFQEQDYVNDFDCSKKNSFICVRHP